MTAEELHAVITLEQDCSKNGSLPALTLVDLRTEHHVQAGPVPVVIKTPCPTVFCLMDDLRQPTVRDQIPRSGIVVTLTETGNRDKFVMQYLSKFGYTNVKGLLFGMRGWIKAGYPTHTKVSAK